VEGVLAEVKQLLAEGEGLPVGTKRTRSDGVYKKIKKGVWKRVSLGGQGQAALTTKSGADKFWDALAKTDPKFKAPEPGQQPAPGALAPILPGRQWTEKKRPFESSEAQHKKGGDWTPERKELHKKIIAQFLDAVPSVPKDKQPTAIMMMGGPATGKGALTSKIPSDRFVKVDADSIKEMLPEYQEGVREGDRNAASYVHKESGELASKLRDIARSQRKNMVLDGTGRFASSYMHRMDELQRTGYHVQLMMPVVDDVNKVVSRAKQRGEESGRWVPEEFIRDNHEPIMKNFDLLAKKADSAFLFNNNGEKPKLAWARYGDWEEDSDPEFTKTFRETYSSRRKESIDIAFRTASVVKGLVEETAPEFDPRQIVKTALKEIPARTKKDKRFSPDEGILEPVDSSI
jgi:predicted ABC-type ATPase